MPTYINYPNPTNAQIREAFVADGLSLDPADNEWIEMQETVATLVRGLVKVLPSDPDGDVLYAKADLIVGRIDAAGKV